MTQTQRQLKADPISDAIGSRQFLEPWYPDELRQRIFGNLRAKKETIRISRWYPNEKIAVDYEPDPRDEPFYVEEKRLWCAEQGYVYVPIYLADQLSADAFAKRLADARTVTRAMQKAQANQQALDEVKAGPEGKRKKWPVLNDPEVVLWVDQEAVRRVEAGIAEGKDWKAPKKRQGALSWQKQCIIKELTERYPDGRVGPEHRARVAPDAARG